MKTKRRQTKRRHTKRHQTKKGGSRKKSATEKGPQPSSQNIRVAQQNFRNAQTRKSKNYKTLTTAGIKPASSSQNTQPN